MKRYLLTIEDEEAWAKFKQVYKKKKLGKNLDQAIMKIIKEAGK